MDIKKNLKDFDIKISKMASDLGISRPTLDSYIECFENGKEIPNEAIQAIFEFLFSKEISSSVEFAQKYDYVKRVMLKNAKEMTASQKELEKRNLKIQNVVKIINDNDTTNEMVSFINLLLTNKDNELVKNLGYYFNYSNGLLKIDTNTLSNKQLGLYSNLAKTFALYQSDSIEVDEFYLKELVEKNEKIRNRKVGKVQSEDIIKYIKENISDSGNIHFELLEQMINAKEEE